MPPSVTEPSRNGSESRLDPALREKTVAGNTLDAAARAQYQRLATTLHQAQAERGIRTILVSSAAPAEGKSLTAVNLALTLSRSFRRAVLLIDADFRRPSVHEYFQLPITPGFMDVMRGTHLPPQPEAGMLAVLPAGKTTDAVGALSSPKLDPTLQLAGEGFDWVIIDSPPVGLLSDAKLMAPHTDGVLLVISAGSTQFGLVQNAVDAFGRERILGVVLNKADRRAVSHGYGYNYDYYYSPREGHGKR